MLVTILYISSAIMVLMLLAFLSIYIYMATEELRDRRFLSKVPAWKNAVSRETKAGPLTDLLSAVNRGSETDPKTIDWNRLLSDIDQLADRYLKGADDEREEIRNALASSLQTSNALLKYARLSAHKLNSELETETHKMILERGLAAVSMANLQLGWKESTTALRTLYEKASKVGLEPDSIFEKISLISSSENTKPKIDDHPSMRTFIGDFLEFRRQEKTARG